MEYVDLESQKDKDNPLVHSFEKVHTATEYQSGRKQLDGSDQLAEQEEALEELELSKLTRTSETAQSVYRADLQAGLHTADLDEEPASTRAHRYPEWNFKRREYRDDWCTVNEQISPPSGPASALLRRAGDCTGRCCVFKRSSNASSSNAAGATVSSTVAKSTSTRSWTGRRR